MKISSKNITSARARKFSFSNKESECMRMKCIQYYTCLTRLRQTVFKREV